MARFGGGHDQAVLKTKKAERVLVLGPRRLCIPEAALRVLEASGQQREGRVLRGLRWGQAPAPGRWNVCLPLGLGTLNFGTYKIGYSSCKKRLTIFENRKQKTLCVMV